LLVWVPSTHGARQISLCIDRRNIDAALEAVGNDVPRARSQSCGGAYAEYIINSKADENSSQY